ncbi:hypothetical protein ACK6ST_04785 [Proteus terrae]|uniref:hypothetical protein n=1 Tax=Proteus terrae TaxID=1574161 RepID=UPI003C2F0FF2
MTDKLYTYGNITHKQLPSHREELRDKFAKAAIQPLIAHFDYGRIGLTQERMDAIAKEAYGMADAMLKARG